MNLQSAQCGRETANLRRKRASRPLYIITKKVLWLSVKNWA